MVFCNCCYKHVIDEPCPEENKDYHVVHPKFPVVEAPTTETWQICAAKCSNEPSCNYWTWFKNTQGYKKGKCLFKPNREKEREDERAISGSKHCLDVPGKNPLLYR